MSVSANSRSSGRASGERAGWHRNLWRRLKLDDFWRERLGMEPRGDGLAGGAEDAGELSADLAGQRVAPASRVVRAQRDGRRAGPVGEAIELQAFYRCQDKLLVHKAALFSFLRERWQDLFRAEYEVLLYDLTRTYFECDPPARGKRRFGYSRDKRQTACK